MLKDIKVEEILVYLMLIVVGYYIAKMFSRSCNGFSVGGQRMTTCDTFVFMPCPGAPEGDTNMYKKTNQESIQTPNNGYSFAQDCCN